MGASQTKEAGKKHPDGGKGEGQRNRTQFLKTLVQTAMEKRMKLANGVKDTAYPKDCGWLSVDFQ